MSARDAQISTMAACGSGPARKNFMCLAYTPALGRTPPRGGPMTLAHVQAIPH
jgi:hypothetical protein